jgi:hypothetical protein
VYRGHPSRLLTLSTGLEASEKSEDARKGRAKGRGASLEMKGDEGAGGEKQGCESAGGVLVVDASRPGELLESREARDGRSSGERRGGEKKRGADRGELAERRGEEEGCW